MNSWIIIIPIVISVGTLLLAIFNARNKVESDVVDSLSKLVQGLKINIDVLNGKNADLEHRMVSCENARVDLANENIELQRENNDLLRKVVEQAVLDKVKK